MAIFTPIHCVNMGLWDLCPARSAASGSVSQCILPPFVSAPAGGMYLHRSSDWRRPPGFVFATCFSIRPGAGPAGVANFPLQVASCMWETGGAAAAAVEAVLAGGATGGIAAPRALRLATEPPCAPPARCTARTQAAAKSQEPSAPNTRSWAFKNGTGRGSTWSICMLNAVIWGMDTVWDMR
jgi:hypothetical protein